MGKRKNQDFSSPGRAAFFPPRRRSKKTMVFNKKSRFFRGVSAFGMSHKIHKNTWFWAKIKVFRLKNTNILEFNAFGKRKNFWIRNGFVTFHELFETKIFENFCNFFGVASYSWKIKIFWKVLKNVKNAFPHVERGPKTHKFSNKKKWESVRKASLLSTLLPQMAYKILNFGTQK